jgi:hypothetical protein
MSIKFICSCGKHLRARDEMAARRSMCPRCGAPVGIPSLRPTHAGTVAGPLTPQERRRLRRDRSPETPGSEPASTITADHPPDAPFGRRALRLPWRIPRVRRRRQLETHWYQCFVYPFLNWGLLLLMTFALTLLSGGIVLLIPELPRFAALTPKEWLPYATALLMSLLLFAYVCGTVECALKSAVAGEGPGTYWPGRHVFSALKSIVRWLICFLAGPVAPLVLAGYFWIYGGDLTRVDRAIVAELIWVGGAYWLLAVMCSTESDRLRDANPVRIGQLLYRLRYRAVVPILLAPALAFLHGLAIVFALAEIHQHAVGWLVLECAWLSGLFCTSFLFRLLGVWCYHSVGRQRQRPEESSLASRL